MSKQTDLINIPDAITVSGSNVGIGVSPSTNLHVKSSNGGLIQTIEASDSGNAYTKYINSTTGSGDFTDGLLVGIDTDESATFWQFENTHMKFGTNGTERMRIDATGAVTMPSQPAFFAHRNGGNYTETTATAKVRIDGTRFNHGGHYDTTNNRFVAPVDGAYQFNASVNCYFISPGYQLRAYLFVNGSSYAVGDSFHSSNNAHDLVASVSHVIYLSANDYVEVWSFSDDGSRGFSSSPVWNTFSGYLLG